MSSAITRNGGRTIINFKDNDLPSHLCLSESEFTKASNAKGWTPSTITPELTANLVKEVVAYNETHFASPIAIVSEKWILDSVASNALVDEAAYIHGSAPSPSQSIATINSDPSTSRQRIGSKRERRSSGNSQSLLPSKKKSRLHSPPSILSEICKIRNYLIDHRQFISASTQACPSHRQGPRSCRPSL